MARAKKNNLLNCLETSMRARGMRDISLEKQKAAIAHVMTCNSERCKGMAEQLIKDINKVANYIQENRGHFVVEGGQARAVLDSDYWLVPGE